MRTCKTTPIRLSADFSAETLQARREWHNIFKVMERKNLQPFWVEYSPQQDSPSHLMEKSKVSRQAKVKRIQHHQTSFTTNAKETSLGRKQEKEKTLPTENKSKTTKKIIGSYILIITFNINGLNAPSKRHNLAEQMKTYACMHFYLPYHSA